MRKWVTTCGLGCLLMLGLGPAGSGCDATGSRPSDTPGHLTILGLRTPQPVLPDAALVVEFSEPFVLATVSVSMVEGVSGDDVPCTCTKSTANASYLDVTPDAPLKEGAQFRLTIDAGVRASADGDVELQSDWSLTFWTVMPSGMSLEFSPFDVVRHGLDVYGIWCSTEGRVEVGQDGFALIGNSTSIGRWVLPTGTTSRVNDVWCSGTGVAYVVHGPNAGGGGTILRYADGKRATAAQPDQAVSGVHGVDPALVYATAGDSVIEISDIGQRVFTGTDPVLRDIWVYRDATDHVLWVVGSAGLYRAMPTATGADLALMFANSHLSAVTGRSASEVAAVGLEKIYRKTGTDLLVDEDPGYAWMDVTWHPDAPGPTAVGATPLYNGAQVTYHAGGPFRTHVATDPLYAVHSWKITSDTIVATAAGAYGTSTIGDLGSDAWSTDLLGKRDAAGGIASWDDLMGTEGGALLALRGGRLWGYDGATRIWIPRGGPTDLVLTHLYCDAGNSIYVAGVAEGGFDRFVSYFDGAGWDTQWMSSMDEPRDIWAADASNIFVVCDYGVVYKMGGVWTPMTVIRPGEQVGQHLRGVWGTAADSVYVVGENGTIAHYPHPDPQALSDFETLASGTTNHLNAIWGASESHIVAVGDDGTILQSHNGTTWITVQPPIDLTGVDLAMVWTDAFNNIWAASRDGVVIHFDGAEWRRWEVPVPLTALNAIASRFSDIWFGGEYDLLLRYAEPPDRFVLIDKD